MLVGLLLLCYGGIKFEKFILYLATGFVLVFCFFLLLSYLDITLNAKATGLISSITLTITAIYHIISRIYKKVKLAIIGYLSATLGFQIAKVLNVDLLTAGYIVGIFFFILKILFALLVIRFRDFLLLLCNSFIGACLFIYNFGYLAGSLENFMAVLERL